MRRSVARWATSAQRDPWSRAGVRGALTETQRAQPNAPNALAGRPRKKTRAHRHLRAVFATKGALRPQGKKGALRVHLGVFQNLVAQCALIV